MPGNLLEEPAWATRLPGLLSYAFVRAVGLLNRAANLNQDFGSRRGAPEGLQMSDTLKETESVLRDVIKSLIDGQEGFKDIGEKLEDDTLKRYFLAESLKRAQFKGELEDVLIKEGVSDAYKESGTIAGALHRTWGDLKAKLGGTDHTLLESAEQGEDVAKKAYADALKHELPLPIHQLLSTQAAHIQTSHDYVKAARDSRK